MADISNADVTLDPPVPAQGIADSDVTLDSDKYGGVGQGIQAGVEGALRGAVSSPIANAVETKLGFASPEGIRGRQEAHPVASSLGEASTLLGGALTGTGEAAALEKAGSMAASGLKLAEPTTYAARVGSAIVKNAAEMAAYQSQDEAGKAILNDPNVGAQSAISHIGLMAALGGAGGGLIAGVASPLWQAAVGSKLATGLKDMVSHIGGVEGDEAVNKAGDLAQKIGIELPSEVSSVVNETPMSREAHSFLSQDDATVAGRAYQGKLQKLNADLGDKVAESLGKTPEDVANIPEKNSYETGQALGTKLHDELKPTVTAINDAYEDVTNKFKSAAVSDNSMRSIGDELAQKSISEGWTKSFDDANNKLVSKILEKLPEQKTINDLKQAISNLYRPFDAPDFKAALEAKKILSKGLESAVSEHMGPEELQNYVNLRKNYANLSNHLEDLDQHLHVGRWNGPGTFLAALKEKADTKGEQLLSNMTNKNNANLLELLKSHPETLSGIGEHYKNDLLRSATKGAAPGELLKTGRLVSDIGKLTPQQKALVASPEQHQRIEAVDQLLNSLKDPTHNFSNTARTLRKHMAGAVSPISLIAGLMGHGEAGVLSYLGQLGLSEGRSGIKLGLLKMLGSSKSVDAAGFKAATEYFTAAQKGANALSKSAENVFKPGIQVMLPSQLPSTSQLEKLDKMVADNDPKDNNKLMQAQNGHVGHYLPEHQAALTESSMRSLQYLRNLKPQDQTNAPLDKAITPTPQQEARYQRALTIAQQPGVVLQHIKDGTLQTTDLQDLNAMYPSMYQAMSQKLTNDMLSAKNKDIPIPYKTRVSMSLFLGQPLDTSMSPQSIMAAQPAPQPPQQPQGQPMKGRKGKSAIDKVASSYKTPSQTAESDRSSRD